MTPASNPAPAGNGESSKSTPSTPAPDSSFTRVRDAVGNAFRHLASLFPGSRRPSAQPSAAPELGQRGKSLRVLAFAGGGFDTAIQLGVTHALLVSKGQAPDVVAGVSAGAINAVALAEILQAGLPKETDIKAEDAAPTNPDEGRKRLRQERVAQVSKFREVFENYLNAPGEFINSAMPDAYEVNARRPLRPQELPVQQRIEREERGSAAAARFGLVRLLNGVLSIRLNISTLTLLVRRLLEIAFVREMVPIEGLAKPLFRWWKLFHEIVALWWTLSTRIIFVSPILGRVGWGICTGGFFRTLTATERAEALTS
jgi:hypothetical protein